MTSSEQMYLMNNAPLCKCDYGAQCVGDLQNGQAFHFSFVLENRENSISGFLRNNKGVFPFETNKTLCEGRFALRYLERYSIQRYFSLFFFFFKESIPNQIKQCQYWGKIK